MGFTESISLIGMPGVGKSSVGVLLAKRCGLRFRDTDIDIQVREGATLEEILQRDGFQRLRQVEEEVLLSIDLAHAVIATGGSAVYSRPVMDRLHSLGPVIYLEADLNTLVERVGAAPPRGIANAPGQSFADIFAERTPLYQHQATLAIDASRGTPEDTVNEIISHLADTGRTCPRSGG